MSNVTITLPSLEHSRDTIVSRWRDVLADPVLQGLPHRIETDRFGNIVMSPPPAFDHGGRVWVIQRELVRLLGGRPLPECPVLTVDGMKGVDIGWYSEDRYRVAGGNPIPSLSPEICIEVLSPSNSGAEMDMKRELYFEAGAEECWQCDRNGSMMYYAASAPTTALEASPLCPDFPATINE